MHLVLSVLMLATLISVTYGRIEQMPLPDRMQDCFNRFSEKTSIVDTVGESIASFCFDQYLWKAARENGLTGFNITRQAYVWVNNLMKKSDVRRQKRQAPQLRVRKEYRRMTEEERANYHRAIQLLKADTSILPNRYDALSAIHHGVVTTSAHGGPNFLPFHRIYVLMFENALREMVPGVTVPYWDSTLDEALPDPTQSVLFTETFLGDGFGIVQTGPFAHWNTLAGPLTRNIGQSGQLFKPADIARVTTRLRLAEISEPNAPVNSSLEFHHNQVHLWVGGQMASLHTAAHDPVFWLHHSYVDYVWEQFRRYQRANGVDPTRDYPTFVNDSMHLAGAPMGLSNLRNIDGMSDVFTSFHYTYEPSPTCSQRFPDCGSPYLRCVIINRRARCISADRSAAPQPSPVLMGFGMGGAAMSLMAAVRNQQIQQQAFQQQQLQRSMAMRQNLINMAMVRQRMAGSQMMQTPNIMMNSQQQIAMPQMMTSLQQGMTPQVGMQTMPSRGQTTAEQESLDDPGEGGQGRNRRKRYAKKKKMTPSYQKQFTLQSRPTRQISWQTSQRPAGMMAMPISNQMGGIPQSDIFQNATQVLSHNLDTCPSIPVTRGYQNTFNINGQSDINQWVYIPVKVVYQRPPTYATYTSFPVVNGEPDEEHDIYSLSAQMQIKNYVAAGKPAFYDKCLGLESGAGKVYINSQGINYMGTYKEYAIVDHRLAVSISTAYVAVKSPEFGASEVYLSAYDSCGRVCQPYCKMAGMPGLQRCSGAFRITSDSPKLYGMNYGEAVSNLWQFNEGGGCPLLSQDNVYIQFYCSFRDAWPFTVNGGAIQQQQAPSSQLQNAPQLPNAPQTSAVPDDMEPIEQNSGTNNSIVAACNVGHGCIITGACQRCREGVLYACAGLCSVYTSCQNGIHFKMTCNKGTWFDPDVGMCVPGQCIDRPFQWWYRQNASEESKQDLKK